MLPGGAGKLDDPVCSDRGVSLHRWLSNGRFAIGLGWARTHRSISRHDPDSVDDAATPMGGKPSVTSHAWFLFTCELPILDQ